MDIKLSFGLCGVLIAAISDPDRAAAKRVMDAMMTMRRIDIAKIEAVRTRHEAT